MVAVPEVAGIGRLVQRRAEPVRTPVARRRLVAVAVSPMELLRPESDLARLVAEAGRVDLLIARDDAPTAAEVPAPQVSPEAVWTEPPGGVDLGAWADLDELDDLDGFEDEDEEDDGLAAAVAALDLPDLHLHRLGLSGRIGADATDVLVAALSELVGFDPESGVYCVAPLPAPNDPERTAVVAAAQRIVRVYGLPLLRYRSLELSVVTD
ncbi:hypothetical protein [Pseudonocardia pini]|uniref:hypothetical protein n=1 Tax=Pseudonocardia pini TaxID=2758030 RepID=UPI0015F0A914|nr:hypothetical protein [Pseudonocardia pini]